MSELKDQIANALTNQHRIAFTEEFLLKRLEVYHQPRSWVDQVIHQIENFSSNDTEINHLAASVGVGDRQFRRRFLKDVGISPKKMIRIHRAHSVLGALKKDRSNNLTELGYKLGYFDQSHFIKDVKSLLGKSPSRLLAHGVNRCQRPFIL